MKATLTPYRNQMLILEQKEYLAWKSKKLFFFKRQKNGPLYTTIHIIKDVFQYQVYKNTFSDAFVSVISKLYLVNADSYVKSK